MMTLDVKISIVVIDSQVAQHPLRLRQGILEFGGNVLKKIEIGDSRSDLPYNKTMLGDVRKY